MLRCDKCDLEFQNHRQLNGHKRLHGPSGGGYSVDRSYRKPITCLGCETEFFSARGSHGKYCSLQCQADHRRSLKLAEVENGQASARWVKAYLIEKYGDRCMDPECAWDHDARPVKPELEHKDGNSENNSLSNCILLCPCCHSLTPTYKGRNRGNGRHARRTRYAEGKSY